MSKNDPKMEPSFNAELIRQACGHKGRQNVLPCKDHAYIRDSKTA